MASLYLRSRTHQAFDIRDGRKAEDPVRQVGRRPVKFDNLTDSSGTPLDAAFFDRDPQIEAIAEVLAKVIIEQLDKVEADAKADAKKAADAAAAEEARILKERESAAQASALLQAQGAAGGSKEEGQGKKKNKD